MGRRPILDPAATVPGQDVLAALKRYHYLTYRQLARVNRYSAVSGPKYMERTVRALKQANLVHVVGALPKVGVVTGTTQWVISLDRTEKEGWFLKDMHALNELLITMELFSTSRGVGLLAFYHDETMRPWRLKARPDGYVAYQVGKDKIGIAIEFDRGTESYDQEAQSTNWRKKIERLLAFASGPYREVFPCESLTIAVVINTKVGTNEDRLRKLLAWTEKLLTERGKEAWGELFYFTIADPTAMSPQEFVAGPHWIRPFVHQYVPLVAL